MSGDHAICPDCGAENLAGAKFCGTCGKDLAGAAAPATPAEPSPAQPGGGGPKKTMLGMTAIPMPEGGAKPTEPAGESADSRAAGAGRAKTMLGMSPIAPPGQELPSVPQGDAAAPTPDPAPSAADGSAGAGASSDDAAEAGAKQLPATTNRTMLGMPQVEIEKAAAAARAAQSAQGEGDPKPNLGPTHRTMLGMTAQPMPGAKHESHPPGPPAATPVGQRRRRAEVKFDGVSSVPPPPPKKSNKVVIVIGALGVLGLLLIGGVLGLYLALSGDGAVRASVVPTEAGDGLRVEVGDSSTSRVRFGGQEVAVSEGVATFPLAADSLHLGDNDLTVELIDGEGEAEAHEVTVTVSYRIRADVTTLTAEPPVLTIVVDALPGSDVTIGGESVTLDAEGRGQKAFSIEVDSDASALEHRAEYHVSLPDGQEHAGAVETRVPYATLQIDRPGRNVVTEAESVEVAGAVNRAAALTIDGTEVEITAEGRFVHSLPLESVGEHEVRVVARQPGRAPRVVTISIRRVEDLAREAASFTPEPGLTYARIAQNPTIYRDQRIALEGRVYNINIEGGRSVLQMLVRECPRGERCPLWVTYPQATDATINDWVRVLGTVAGEQQFRSESGRVITVPRVDAQYVLPARAR